LLLILATFAVLGWSRTRVGLRDLLLLVVSLYASLCSIRMIPLFVLIAVPLVSRQLSTRGASQVQTLRTPIKTRASLNAAIVMAMAVFAGIHIWQVIERQPQAESQHFPTGATAYLETHSPGRIFNHYDWGGYLIWRLHPHTPVFIDGRADVYGQQLFDQFAATYQFKDRWQQTLQEWKVDTVIVPSDSALATGLQSSPGWRVFYKDAQAIILTESPAPSS
jgi:hypothetical protein